MGWSVGLKGGAGLETRREPTLHHLSSLSHHPVTATFRSFVSFKGVWLGSWKLLEALGRESDPLMHHLGLSLKLEEVLVVSWLPALFQGNLQTPSHHSVTRLRSLGCMFGKVLVSASGFSPCQCHRETTLLHPVTQGSLCHIRAIISVNFKIIL